jgi:N-sulfoglucosamine sulfohydrolase
MMRLFVLFFALVSTALAADSRPNIFFFIGDNWSAPHASALGDPTVKTPTFDRIVREGALFTRTFCPVPSCSPTRSSVLTGRAAHQLEDAASLWSRFPRKLQVFTDMLSAAGYEVGFSGKGWSPGTYLEEGWPQNPAGKQYMDFHEFLQQRDKTKPFFFWNGNTDTSLHKWRYEPEGWAGLDPKTLKVPPMLPDTEEVRLSMLAYYGGVMRMDAEAASCMQALEKDSSLASTCFVYTSDNGWQMPRGLANCYDTGTHVPLAVRWPQHTTAGTKSDAFINLNDLAPTFLEIAGVPVPKEMTARSFADLLNGKGSSTARDHVFLERERHANVRRGDLSYPIRAIRTADHLFLWNMRPERWPAGDPKAYYAVGDYGDVDDSRAKLDILARKSEPSIQPYFDLNFGKRPEYELYDLNADPHQLKNLAGESTHSTVRDGLKNRVLQWMRDTADPRIDPSNDEWDKYPYFGGRAVDENGKIIPKGQRKKKAS